MSDIRTPQNPGIGGIDELTLAEELVVQQIAALGDPGAHRILGWDNTDNSFQFFVIGSGLTYTQATHTLSSSATGTTLTQETPTGTVDASNNVFTTANTPVFVVVDGLVRPLVADINDINGNGFTYSGGSITVHSAAPPVNFIRSYYNA